MGAGCPGNIEDIKLLARQPCESGILDMKAVAAAEISALQGVRSLASMKHFVLNIASARRVPACKGFTLFNVIILAVRLMYLSQLA